jgi:predicted phage terminase large subunit-like protein
VTLLEYYEAKRPRSYETNWHHRWVCDVIERAYAERKNVVLELPPRHGKSELVNAYAPAWRLGTHFDECFGLVTNSDNLAKKFSVACRSLVDLPLDADRDAQWKVRGVESLNYSYLAAGVRGQLTGHGFSVAIFDDLLKSGLEANSETTRETVWTNVVSAAVNRLSPDGVVIAMQARLHQADPVGKLVALAAEDPDALRFIRLHLPATNDDGRSAWLDDGYTGERTFFPAYAALWPTRYPREKLDQIRATVTGYYWAAQYQQEPSLGEQAIFVGLDALPKYEHPVASRCWLAWDCAQTATAGGSYSAGVALGYDPAANRLLLLDVARGKWRQDQLLDEVRSQYGRVARLTGIRPEAVVVERAAAGFGVIDNLAGQLPVEPAYPHGSKEDRAASVCHYVNRGQLAVPREAAWVKAWLDEMKSFPLGNYKDQVDATVWALAYVERPGEFKPRPVEIVTEYDALAEYGGGMSPDLDEADEWGSR